MPASSASECASVVLPEAVGPPMPIRRGRGGATAAAPSAILFLGRCSSLFFKFVFQVVFFSFTPPPEALKIQNLNSFTPPDEDLDFLETFTPRARSARDFLCHLHTVFEKNPVFYTPKMVIFNFLYTVVK